MANFEAEIRLYDLTDTDAVAARKAVDERLRAAGFSRWRVLSVARQGVTAPLSTKAPRPLMRPTPHNLAQRARAEAGQGAWIVVAALAWAVWFVWLLGG